MRPTKDSNVMIGVAFGVAAIAGLVSGYALLNASETANATVTNNPELFAQHTEQCLLEQVGHAIFSPSVVSKEGTLELTFSRAQAEDCMKELVETEIATQTQHTYTLSGFLGVAGIVAAGLGGFALHRNRQLDRQYNFQG